MKKVGVDVLPDTEQGKRIYKEAGYVCGVDLGDGKRSFFKTMPDTDNKWFLPDEAQEVIYKAALNRCNEKVRGEENERL